MAKKLVVVESPSKAKTINKYLGRNFIVEASVGHIKDLAKTKLGVDTDNGFKPKYITIKGKGDVIKKLRERAKHADEILIATDPDREGEAIAFHVSEEVAKENKNIKRVIFNEITKKGVKHGISHPRDINMEMFMSQQARRVLDRLIGFKVSPFLSRAMLDKTSIALSAGRVQSVALRLICEREHSINIFEPIDYWSIKGDFLTPDSEMMEAKLVAFDGENIKNPEGSKGGETESDKKKKLAQLDKLHYIKSEKQAKELLGRILKEQYKIDKITKRQTQRKPQPPFTTSLLQQEASKRLGFSNKKTMMLAQRLYEGIQLGKEGAVGLITYMRTDSVRLAPEAVDAAREHIGKEYGQDFLPGSSPVYSSKSGATQDAHEAIRPTGVNYTPAYVKQYIDRDEAALYELIYNRFLASQMSNAIIDQTSVKITGGDFVFRASGSIIKFKGFLAVYDDINEDKHKPGKNDSKLLPAKIAESDELELKKSEYSGSQTKPPARYNEASLVKELDELGIGRPSTYAQIISTLIDRQYVDMESKAFFPTEIGLEVNKTLVRNFPELFNVEFTAKMEEELDTIAIGNLTYEDMLHDFYGPFTTTLKKAEESGAFPEFPCPECGKPMDIRVGRNGRFLGCTDYPECKGTSPLPRPGGREQKEEPVIAEGVMCDECGAPMYLRESRFGKFYGCTRYPECKGKKPFTIGVTCPKCKKGELSEKYSPKSRRKFYGCTRYPDCDFISNYEPVSQKCGNCGHDYLEIRFKKSPDGYTKYLRCPNCKDQTEFSE